MPARRRALAAAVLATAVAAVGFLPWADSGSASRSGYALARVLRDVGPAEGTAGRLSAGVLATPLLAAVAWAGVVVSATALAAGATVLAGGLAVAAGVTVLRSGAVDARAGAVAGVAVGTLAVLCGLWAAVGCASRPRGGGVDGHHR